MENSPLVSILINCYNSSNFIVRAVSSVINQTYQNWELIIWDDGSTDDTIKILKNKFNDKRIKIFSQNTNEGLGPSRINAIKKINGSLVSILDADDFYNNQKIYKQVEVFKMNKKVAICATWANFYDESLNLVEKFESELTNEEIKRRLLLVNIFPHSSVMYRKDLAINCGWYSELYEYSQDFDLTVKLIKNNELYLVKENLTNITQPSDSMTKSEKYNFIRIKENIKILETNLKHDKLSNKDFKRIKSIIETNYLKLSIKQLKTDFLQSIIKIFSIIFKNPLIFFKFKLVRTLLERKKK